MKTYLLLILIILPTLAGAQIINTIVGNTLGYAGDGGPASSASIHYPSGIATDSTGNIYFSDVQNNCIRKISIVGIISTIAGNGSAGFSGDGGHATSAQLNQPLGIAIDKLGNVYIADNGNGRIRKVNSAGMITTIAGNGTSIFSGDGGSATSAGFKDARNITVDLAGQIYVSDYSDHRIRMINSAGIISTYAGTGGFGGHAGDGYAATLAALKGPTGIAMDKIGNLLICEAGNSDVRMVTRLGIISTIAGIGSPAFGGDGGPATSAFLNVPMGINVDSGGAIYLSDCYNSRIRVITATNTIFSIAGDGVAGYSGDGIAATTAEINLPRGIAVDRMGNIYIADYSNNRVRKISPITSLFEPTILQKTFSLEVLPSNLPMGCSLLITSQTNEDAKVAVSTLDGRQISEFAIPTNKKTQIAINGISGLYIFTAITEVGKKSKIIFLSATSNVNK